MFRGLIVMGHRVLIHGQSIPEIDLHMIVPIIIRQSTSIEPYRKIYDPIADIRSNNRAVSVHDQSC